MNASDKSTSAGPRGNGTDIEALLPDLDQALARHGAAVLQAPPGSGKTTVAPPALMGSSWLAGGRIVMLEPRRLAARASARWMARTLSEPLGATVGYRTRLDSRMGPDTRLEVITEGILTRKLQRDPSLKGTGLVIFDEFHERSLAADLGLALCLDVRAGLRPDLRLLIMSATLDEDRLAALLSGAPVICGGRRPFAVETYYRPPHPGRRIEAETAAAVRVALREQSGSILVFLPGEGEIRRTAAGLTGHELPPQVDVVPLFGRLSRDRQDAAIQPAPAGRRKVVLATSIAETSLTIEGIRVVIDAGKVRVNRFDVRSGMNRLVTLPVSRDAAEQRRGRAGRTAPGVCYRLWPESHNRQLRPRRRPEILDTDLAALALELRLWGVTAPDPLNWLDSPPPGAWGQAVALLGRLGAVDDDFRMTERGRRMAGLGMHPRLGRMVIAGLESGCGPLALALAALLEERDILRTRPDGRDADLRTRVQIFKTADRNPESLADPRVNAAACRRVLRTAAHWRRRLGSAATIDSATPTGRLLACAYPDRIGRRRTGAGARYLLSGGRGARLDESDPLAANEFIVAAHLDGAGPEARIFLAAPIRRAEIEELFGSAIRRKQTVRWDRRRREVVARVQICLDRLVLSEKPHPHPRGEEAAAALLSGLRQLGLQVLPWEARSRNLQARIGLMAKIAAPGGPWPQVSERYLEDTMEAWLRPWIEGLGRIEHLKRLDMRKILRGMLSYRQAAALKRLAPMHYGVPSGSRIAIEYTAGEAPVLRVRLQEMFGQRETPVIAGGKVPLLLHLLSPAMRPVQVTQDLESFWKHGYPQVRKELRGRYPRHHWPLDPFGSKAVRGVRPRKRY